MTTESLKDYSKNHPEAQSLTIHFFGANYHDHDGNPKNLSFSVTVDDGDVEGILAVVKENGGLGAIGDDGVFRFLPWPCAAVEITAAAKK